MTRDECPTCHRPRDDDWVVWCPVSRTLAEMLRDKAGMTTEYPVTMRLGPDDVIVIQQHYPDGPPDKLTVTEVRQFDGDGA